MAEIEYFYSLASPFTYLAGDGLEKIADEAGAQIHYRPADFPAIFAETGGLPPAKRHPFRQEYRLQELRRLSAHAGLPINLHPKFWPVDPVPATLAVLAVAEAGGDAGTLSRAFLSACWAEERNIADDATIGEVLVENGHEADAISAASSAQRGVFDANTARAMGKGVFGAPFYIVGDERFWGHDRLSFVAAHLKAAGSST
ncbi:MAG: 2-hydroxychromene-2-carboxylate isomerase [Paracoccaceae bacterium]